MQYQQVLLETADGLFSVSVTGDVELDDRQRIVNPQDVFDDGSIIVAVQQGVLPAGDYVEHPNPFEVAEIHAKSSGNGGGTIGPKDIHSEGPKYGSFILRLDGTNQVTLRPIPTLGQIT